MKRKAENKAKNARPRQQSKIRTTAISLNDELLLSGSPSSESDNKEELFGELKSPDSSEDMDLLDNLFKIEPATSSLPSAESVNGELFSWAKWSESSADPDLLDNWLNDSFDISPVSSPAPDKIDELFSPLPVTPPSFIGNKESRNNKLKGNYTIYTKNTLPELLDEIRRSTDKETISLRFVLTPEYELLFASDGIPTPFIPAHFSMTGLSQLEAFCITAGSIEINKENEIIFVNHKSGDFKPSWESLQYGIFALLACDANFAEQVQVEKCVAPFTNLKTTSDQLKKEIDSRFSEDTQAWCREINNELVNRNYSYPLNDLVSNLKDGNRFFNKKIDFLDVEETDYESLKFLNH